MSSEAAESTLIDECSRLDRLINTRYGLTLADLSPEALSKLGELAEAFDHFHVPHYDDLTSLMTKWLTEEARRDELLEATGKVKAETLRLSEMLQSTTSLSRELNEHLQDIEDEARLYGASDDENSVATSNSGSLSVKAKSDRLQQKSLEYIERKKRLLQFYRTHKKELAVCSHAAILAKHESFIEVSAKLETVSKERSRFRDLSHDATMAQEQLASAKGRLEELRQQFEKRIAALDM